MNENLISHETILQMLGIVLVEIRAGDIPDYSVKMSDVFHNAPAGIINNIPAKQIYKGMTEIAERNGSSNYLKKLTQHCLENINH